MTKHKSRKPHRRANGPSNRASRRDGRFYKNKFSKPKHLPQNIFEVQVAGLTEDGEAFCRATENKIAAQHPLILLESDCAAKIGQTVLVEITTTSPESTFVRTVSTQEPEVTPLLGTVKLRGSHYLFIPFDRELQSIHFEFFTNIKQLKIGSAVKVRPARRPSHGATPVELIEQIAETLTGMETTIAIANHNLPTEFPSEVLGNAAALPAKLTAAQIAEREDLRHIPLVTIDGEDARDFDDAVFAEPWNPSPDNSSKTPSESAKSRSELPSESGFHIIVAIADVAHYIEQGSPLDEEALNRGNSTYFPDKVIPMLPERISNDLCSLRPQVDRATLAVHMYINKYGQLKKHKFTRAIIHSAARLTYTRVQKAIDGNPDEEIQPLMTSVIEPLYAAYKVLLKSRKKRGAIDLDIPEKYINIGENGEITSISKRERLDAHQLIEEFMVLANVAAATSLEGKGAPALYRIHPAPGKEKLDNLKVVLKQQGIKFNVPAGDLKPSHFAKLANQARGHEAEAMLMQSLLQSQQQASYDPQNIGHFGLALGRYAHFTSPIRRYSDLIVHRSLIKTLNLAGDGALQPKSNKKLLKIAENINLTERRSQKAEWEARDRMVANFYNKYVGKEFEGKVTTVQPFGAFLTIDDGAAEGLLPMRLMKNDYFRFDDKRMQLVGRKTNLKISLGSILKVKLIASDAVEGRLTFALA